MPAWEAHATPCNSLFGTGTLRPHTSPPEPAEKHLPQSVLTLRTWSPRELGSPVLLPDTAPGLHLDVQLLCPYGAFLS